MRFLPIVLPILLLAPACTTTSTGSEPAGVAGAAALTPLLELYGMNAREARCVAERLAARLSEDQRGRLAAAAPEGAGRTPRDLLRLSASLGDSAIGVEVARAAGSCAALPGLAVRRSGSAAPAPAAPIWLNLGRAPTGQSIAVDASSLQQQGAGRQAWFRLTNPGAATPTGIAYQLRVDCRARTIHSLAQRADGPAGPGPEQPSGETPAPIEGGTVMEIAFLALCT